MEAARQLGVSVRRFNGWEPQVHTTVVRDEHGVITGWVSQAEPEWVDEERAWMQALHALEGQVCSGCGGWLPHTTSLELSDGFVADPPYRCHRCEALAIRRRQMRDAPNVEALVVWPVHEKQGG